MFIANACYWVVSSHLQEIWMLNKLVGCKFIYVTFMCQFWCVFFGMAAFFSHSFSPWYLVGVIIHFWGWLLDIEDSALAWNIYCVEIELRSKSIEFDCHELNQPYFTFNHKNILILAHTHMHNTILAYKRVALLYCVCQHMLVRVFVFFFFFPPYAMPFHLHSVILKLESHPCQALKRRLFVTAWQYIIYFWSYHR